MSSLTIGVLLLMFATLHVCARKDEIFDVTEKVLGLKRRDFEIAERSEILTQKIMREDIQEKFDVMEEKSPDALNFVRKLILDAKAVQINEYNEREALKKLRELYQILPGSAKNVLWKLFPKLDSALSGTTPKPDNNSVTGKQGSHSTSMTTTRGTVTGNKGSHTPSSTAPDSLKKPFSDRDAKIATEALESARAYLQDLSNVEKYKNVRKKINHLLTMDPKVWNDDNLMGVLQSFINGINERLKDTAIKNEDFNNARLFLDRLCRAFTHSGGCNIEDIEVRIDHASSNLKDVEEKLKRLVQIIQLQIDDIKRRR